MCKPHVKCLDDGMSSVSSKVILRQGSLLKLSKPRTPVTAENAHTPVSSDRKALYIKYNEDKKNGSDIHRFCDLLTNTSNGASTSTHVA